MNNEFEDNLPKMRAEIDQGLMAHKESARILFGFYHNYQEAGFSPMEALILTAKDGARMMPFSSDEEDN